MWSRRRDEGHQVMLCFSVLPLDGGRTSLMMTKMQQQHQAETQPADIHTFSLHQVKLLFRWIQESNRKWTFKIKYFETFTRVLFIWVSFSLTKVIFLHHIFYSSMTSPCTVWIIDYKMMFYFIYDKLRLYWQTSCVIQHTTQTRYINYLILYIFSEIRFMKSTGRGGASALKQTCDVLLWKYWAEVSVYVCCWLDSV